jgi:WD40 repeat protein
MVITVLFLSANPFDTARLELGNEYAAIADEKARARLRDAFRLQAVPAAKIEDFRRCFEEHRPVVVHFGGHGRRGVGACGARPAEGMRDVVIEEGSDAHRGGGELLVHGEGGRAAAIPIDALAEQFRIDCKRARNPLPVRCVVLNACHSAAQAEAIAKYVDCAIGVMEEIPDVAAIAFARGFYFKLFSGASVLEAFEQGQNEIRAKRAGDPDMLVIRHREGVDPETVYLAEMVGPGPPHPAPFDRMRQFDRRIVVGEAGAEAFVPTEALPPAPFRVPFLRNASFVGRDDDLARLHDLLQKGVAVGVRPAALTGMGGIGKTQLAVEYAYRYANAYPGGVYWMNASELLQTEFARLALEEGLSAGDAFESERQRRLALAFAKHLGERPDALAIFDNVEDPLALRNPGPGFIPAQLGCRLLFTTRRRDPRADFESVEVRMLPPQAAVELLLSTDARRDLLAGGAAPERAEAAMICRMLGHLPLAIALAAAYLDQNPEVALGEYRGRLAREGALATVDDSELDTLELPTRHDAAVGATLRLQWRALEGTARKSQDARLLLTAAALLGEAALVPRVRLGLLTGLRERSEAGHAARLGSALRALRDFSLVEELSEHEVRLHPLVREFAEQQIEAKDTFAAECAARLGEALWDMGRLHEEVGARGIAAVLEDLWIGHTLAGASGLARIAALYRPLARESYALHRWDPASDHGFFLQQLRNRCLDLAITDVMERAEARLEEKRWPWLRERIPTSREPAELVHTLEGHTQGVASVAVTVDGRVAVSASGDTTLKVWDLGSGQALRTLEGHTGRVTGVALTADGRIAVSSSNDRTLKVWDLGSGQALRTLEGHTDCVTGVALTADSRFAVSVSSDTTLKVWDLGRGEALRTLRGHVMMVSGVAVTADGCFAVSVSWDTTLKVWDLRTGQAVHALEGHTSWVTGVALTADGRFALSTSLDKTLKMWDLRTGRAVRSFEGSHDWVRAAALTVDGRLAVSACQDNTLRVWDLRTGQAIGSLEGHTSAVRGVAVTADGRFAISASDDKTLKVWDLGTILASPTRSALRVVVRADGRFAVPDPTGAMKVSELGAGRETRPLEGRTDVVKGVVVTPDGRFIISISHDETQKVWGLGTEQAIRAFEGHTGWATGVAATVDRPFALSASDDEMLKAWDIRTGNASLAPGSRRVAEHDRIVAPANVREGHTGPVLSVAVTANGRFAVSASDDKTLKVWDLGAGRVVRSLRVAGAPCPHKFFLGPEPELEGFIPGLHTGALLSVAVTADGRFAVSASGDTALKVWNLGTGEAVGSLEGHTGPVLGVAVTADGRFAVSASRDQTLKVWDLDTGDMVRSLQGHDAPVLSVALTADGRFALSSSYDQTLKMWDLGRGRVIRSLEWPSVAVAMTADGRIAVSLSRDNTLGVWDLYTGQKVRALQGHTLEGTCVAVTVDGGFAVSASRDNRLTVWDLGAGKPVMTRESCTSLMCCAITQDAKTVLAGDEAGALHILDWRNGRA